MSVAACKIKAVLFDLGGVLTPQPQTFIAKYGKNLRLPPRFLPELFLEGVPNNAFCKLERGEYTLAEFNQHFEAEAKEKAKKEFVILPSLFSAKSLIAGFNTGGVGFDKIGYTDYPLCFEMLRASTILRKNGISTSLVTNNWIDASYENIEMQSQLMAILRTYFTEVVESSRVGTRKPEKKIYEIACGRLGVSPKETAFLDDIGANLKPASEMGMACIKVKDPIVALRQLESITGISLFREDFNKKLVFPAPSHPASVSHGYVNVKPDVTIHYVEVGNGPAVILLHGFPDFWYGWRHQLPALANAGYRAIALDQRGYGESTKPPNITDYSHPELAKDVLSLMDCLGIGIATVVGHDWGGSLAWNLALKYPNRFRAVCGVNTPFFPINPSRNPLVSMYENPGVFDYQLYFQQPGIAEKELENDVEQTISCFYQGVAPQSTKGKAPVESSSLAGGTHNVRERGGILVGLPTKMPRSCFMTEFDLEYYVKSFVNSGFRGPLNWYRNYDANWRFLVPVAHRKIMMPALMVTASHDLVLKPEYSYGMEKIIPNLQRLHIDRCSHWTLHEKPYEFNRGLIDWLETVYSPGKSKL